MWLINTTTLELHNFRDADSAPPYAILSHCWGSEEMCFQDFRKKRKCHGKGYQKIVDCCRFARDSPESARLSGRSMANRLLLLQARLESEPRSVSANSYVRGLEWVWIDTVCIDKRSSAELSEAINSMYEWYSNSLVCLAYLEDVDVSDQYNDTIDAQLRTSRYFSRGWTLQELIAPGKLVFLDKHWRCFGLKEPSFAARDHQPPDIPSLNDIVEAITGVPAHVLRHGSRRSRYSVAERMSWASRRQTSRKEDVAYCLFGLFDVNMPLIYGEGYAAFQRLQREILLRHRDESIYAFSSREHEDSEAADGYYASSCMLAPSPASFAGSRSLVAQAHSRDPVLSVDGDGWRLTVAGNLPPDQPPSVYHQSCSGDSLADGLLAVRLGCVEGETRSPCVLFLAPAGCGHLCRVHTESLTLSDQSALEDIAWRPLTEKDIPDAAAWVPLEQDYSCFIHKNSTDASNCDSGSSRQPVWRGYETKEGTHFHLGGEQDLTI